MIKFVLTACLVAAAKADADPFYGAYGAYGYAAHGLHGAVYGVPFGSSSGLDPITQGLWSLWLCCPRPAWCGLWSPLRILQRPGPHHPGPMEPMAMLPTACMVRSMESPSDP